jgi:hypothetical protein
MKTDTDIPAAETAPAPASAEPALRVAVVRDARGLAEHAGAWEALAQDALEPNPFYESWMMLPALESFGAGAELRFVLIYGPDPARPAGPQRLCGFFPLERLARYKGLPVAALRLWRHKHCFLCTPLIRSGLGREVLERFFDWLREESEAPLFELATISGDGPFHRALVDLLYRREPLWFLNECHTRALLRPGPDGETYLATMLSGDRRRNLKRKERRLAENGAVEYAALDPGAEAHGWIETFLTVEASGWKGRGGTALANDPGGRSFFEAIATEAARRGRLLFYAMRLGGETVALSCYFRAGPAAFWFKPAFDERYAKFSPGLLLKTEITRRLHEVPDLRWVDSCTAADNESLDGLWNERRTILSLVVSTGRGLGDFAVSLLPLLRWLSRRRRAYRAADASPASGAGDERSSSRDGVSASRPPTG